MPDLLAHALIAYTVCRVLSWRHEWITAPYVTVGMAGAFIPDLAKLELLVSSGQVERLLGVTFSWFGLHTGGAVLVSILIGALLVVPSERTRVLPLLAVGATTHLLTDGLLRTASGRSYPMFWPLTQYSPPTPGLYLSTDPEPMLVAAVIAFGVFAVSNSRLNVHR